jgi:hypothetical protein
MKLYHGSKNGEITALQKRQAQAKAGVDVPSDELLNAIYLTPDYGFALAVAANPGGLMHIDDENKTITLENPETFDPAKEVYVYEVDVPDEMVRMIDPRQYVVEHLDEVSITNKSAHQAGEVAQYYRLENVNKESTEANLGFKMR